MTQNPPADVHNLRRFVEAQGPVFQTVLAELQSGRKRSHWMWFIFPQIRGLGHSSTAQYYAIGSLAEAEAYLKHPVLGPRLVECCQLVNRIESRSATEIFGYPDDLKFRSSLTIFARAAPEERAFADALERYFSGAPDPLTLARL